MLLTPHFSLEELTHSDTALRLKLDNTPGPQAIANLKRLASTLEQVRDALGQPVSINVAFRSPEVNKAVGGVPDSAHQKGLAADFISPKFGNPLAICHAILDHKIVFDQLIWEGTWVHLGLSDGPPRRQVLTMREGRYMPGLVV